MPRLWNTYIITHRQNKQLFSILYHEIISHTHSDTLQGYCNENPKQSYLSVRCLLHAAEYQFFCTKSSLTIRTNHKVLLQSMEEGWAEHVDKYRAAIHIKFQL